MKTILFFTLLIFSIVTSSASNLVKVWDSTLVIPTYVLGETNKNPFFYTGRAYQCAQGHVYPYAAQDILTDSLVNVTYKSLHLENEYIRLTILPELGGRIFEAVDKTNDYNIFYKQNVIKPALIGMLGAWISGGVEWGFPHHHRPSTMMEVEHKMVKNIDGSATIWIGEVERRHRMKWIVGVSLHPGSSLIEAELKFFNRTPYAQSMLYWANVATHANEDYRIIFPPTVNTVTYHTKDIFFPWPTGDGIYKGVDYTGVDLSWWKNHPAPVSFFIHDLQQGFLAGYDYGKQAGTVHVADPDVVVCGKLFEWGTSPDSKGWDNRLTDADGPYAELMVGAYSDNQPDYTWMEPYQVRSFKQYWFPLRETENVKEANTKGALNLELEKGKAKIMVNTTMTYKNASVELRNSDEVLFHKNIEVSPDNPFVEKIDLSGINTRELALSLTHNGVNLVYYKQKETERKPFPDAVTSPKAPKDIETVEELYNLAVRFVQFNNPSYSPYDYLHEALKREPGNSDANTFLGILYCKRAMYDSAGFYLNNALQTLEKLHTKPKNGEVYYYLGYALRQQGEKEQAYKRFKRASWYMAWQSAANYQLAEMEAENGQLEQALDYVNNCLQNNVLNTDALLLKAYLQRMLGYSNEASISLDYILQTDPLHLGAYYEKYRLSEKNKEKEEFISMARNEYENFMELSAQYFNWGAWNEVIISIDLYKELNASQSVPVMDYYKAYALNMNGQVKEAKSMLANVPDKLPEALFPYRFESINVLEKALQANPNNYIANYCLGNVYYNYNPDKAVQYWQKAVSINKENALAYRNLSVAYLHGLNNPNKALENMEKAIALNDKDPLWYYELDQIYDRNGTDAQKRLKVLENQHDLISTYDVALEREALVNILVGNFEKALQILSQKKLRSFEASRFNYNLYVDANLLLGLKLQNNKQYEEAQKSFERALLYPENLEARKPFHDERQAEIYCLMANNLDVQGITKKAKEYYRMSTNAFNPAKFTHLDYYKGMALKRLGKNEAANQLFEGLIKIAKVRLNSYNYKDFFAAISDPKPDEQYEAEAYYLMGLGYLGKGDDTKATECFEKAVNLYPNHYWSKSKLAEL